MARVLAGLALLIVCAAGAEAQIPGLAAPSEETPAAAAAPEKDPFGRETPQGLVSGLVSALGAGDYERAVRFFETEKVAANVGRSAVSGADLAREFQEMLDRAGSVVTPAELSSDPAGKLDDGLAEELERIGSLQVTDKDTEPLLAKRVERDGRMLWLVSTESLNALHALAHSETSSAMQPTVVDWIPAGPTLFGAPASHWSVLVALLFISYALAWVLTAARRLFVWAVRRFYGESKLIHFVNATAGPVRLFIAAAIFLIAAQSVGLSVLARYYATFLAQIVAGFSIAWLLWRITDAAGDLVLAQMTRRGRLAAYSFVSFVTRAVKFVLVVLFLAAVLRAFGVNVTAGLAALGIGGLAIALGAQKLFENLIGSLTVIADRPVRIGDFCAFGGVLGTVEDIGIRSTRIRTLDRTVLTVPNGEFASLHIENYSRRDSFWFHPTLNLRYETSPDQIRYLLQELRAMLYAHPKVDPDPARVRFMSLGSHSIDLEIFAYVHARDYNEFLEIQEDLLLRCMDIVEASGSGFAFPSQTLYIRRDEGLDEDKTKAAEKAVEGWRGAEELQVPRFSKEKIDTLRGTIAYPPPGAATR